MFYRSMHILFIILLAMLCAGFGKSAFAQSSLTKQELGIADDEIQSLHEDIARWKSEVEKMEERAKRYEKMAEDAKAQAEKSTHKADKDHWLENAAQRSQRAKNLREDAAKILKKISTRKAETTTKEKKQNIKKKQIRKEKEERITQQKEIEKDRTAKTKNLNSPRFTLEMLFESWEIDPRYEGDDPGVFVIAPENPRVEEYKYSLTLATAEREWKGKFHGAEELDVEGLAKFTYKPTAKEMNPDIPAWARKKIEGQLEWKIVLEQDGTYGTPRLITKFYPGKVEWEETDDEKQVKITDDGEPRVYLYKPIIDDIHAFMYATPEVNIRMKGAPKDETQGIEGLTKLQPFFIDVFLTPEMKAKAGNSLMVDIKGEKGSSTSIKLKAGATNTNGMTIYSHYSPVSIANRGDTRIDDYTPMKGSVDWFMGKVWDNDEYHPGTRLPVNIENGEKVTFSYDGSSYTVPVYETWVQRGIARHVNAMRVLYGFYGFIEGGYPVASQFAKEEAATKLQMMENYKTIMKSEEVNDHIRYVVGEKYFGAADAQGGHMDARMLMPTYSQIDSIGIFKPNVKPNQTIEEMAKEELRAAAFKANTVAGLVGRSRWDLNNKAERGGLNYYDYYDVTTPLTATTRKGELHESGYFDGVLWTHPLEKAIIESAALAANDELAEEMYRDLPIAMAYAMYSGIASATNMDGLYTYAFGENIMGQKVQEWEKRTAGLGFLFGTILTFSLPHIDMTLPSFNNSLKLTGSRRAQRLRAQARTKEVRMLNKSSSNNIKSAKAIISGMSGNVANLPTTSSSFTSPIKCAKTTKVTKNLRGVKSDKGSVTSYKFRDPDAHNATQNKAGAAPPPPQKFVPADTVSNAKGAKLADDVTPLEFQEALTRYGKIEAMGPKLARAQDGQNCNCEWVRLDVAKHLGKKVSQVEMVGRAAKHTPHDVAYLMEDGIPTNAVAAALRDAGFKTVIYNEAQVKPLPMEAYSYLVDQGVIVRIAVEPMGQLGEVYGHALRVREFGRNANGDIETITFFEPAIGRDITQTIANFKRVLANDHGLFMAHPTKSMADIELRMGIERRLKTVEAKKNGISYEEVMKKLYPERHATNDNNAPTARKLDETWHDNDALPANDNAPIKALDETWADGDLQIPTAKINPIALEGNPAVKIKPKAKKLDETWVEEDFDIPPATSAIEKSGSDIGTSKDPASVVESLDPKKKRATNINTPPNEDGED